MEGKVFFVLFSVASLGITAVTAADYKYTDNAPAKWGDKWPICKEKRQSPINIEPCKAVYDKSLGNFHFTNYAEVPVNATFGVKNTGHSFAALAVASNASISGGGLDGSFKIFNFHFHWGKADDGSEHTVNGDQYAGELHLVHYNSKYPDIGTALPKPDGLAVLGVFLKVGNENPDLEKYLKYTANVTEQGANVTGITPAPLNKLLPEDVTSYYRYDGSLTTPKCEETVTWTVFKDTISISNAQLDQLRSLKYGNTTLQFNFRPVQPLNNRTVKTSFQVSDNCPTAEGPTDGATKMQAFSGGLTMILGVLALVSIAL